MKKIISDLYVQYDSHKVSDYHEGKQYGSWSTEYEFKVEGVSLTPRGNYDEEKYALPDIKAGDVVFVLYMIYSSGDSFGSSSGNGEVLWVFKDAALGMKAKEKFSKNEDQFQIDIKTDDGSTFKMSNPAAGYFENISELHLDAFLVNP